jgi:hypothetical protein
MPNLRCGNWRELFFTGLRLNSVKPRGAKPDKRGPKSVPYRHPDAGIRLALLSLREKLVLTVDSTARLASRTEELTTMIKSPCGELYIYDNR